MSIHASKKKETLVRYLNIAQRLVVEIKAYVDSFEEIDDYLIRLQELSNEGYLIITKANNIVVEDIISYIDRTELLIKGFSLYKSLTEYLEVIVQVKNIEEKTFLNFCSDIREIIKGILKNKRQDLYNIKRLLGNQLKQKRVKNIVNKYEQKLAYDEII